MSAKNCTSTFYANNVAFRRGVFAQRPFPTDTGIRKGACQVLAIRLFSDRIPIRLAQSAITEHRLPTGFREFSRQRFGRGRDTRILASFTGVLLPQRLRWLPRFPRALGLAMMAGRSVLSTKQSFEGSRSFAGVLTALMANAVTGLDCLGVVFGGGS